MIRKLPVTLLSGFLFRRKALMLIAIREVFHQTKQSTSSPFADMIRRYDENGRRNVGLIVDSASQPKS